MADGKSAPTVGDLVAANYQILGTAGSGGMGVVYRALDLKLQRTVALKFLPSELNASERDKQRFLQEARTASSLDHPNIGVIYGIEETADDRTFIAMAYYEGQSLATRIRSGPLPPSEAADIAIQVLKALDYAHPQGIEHRDVKPSNIMLTQQTPGQAGRLWPRPCEPADRQQDPWSFRHGFLYVAGTDPRPRDRQQDRYLGHGNRHAGDAHRPQSVLARDDSGHGLLHSQ